MAGVIRENRSKTRAWRSLVSGATPGIAIVVLALAAATTGDALADPPAMQRVHVRTVWPLFGVRARIDEGAEIDLVSGQELELERAQHLLTARCVNDMCEPVSVRLAAVDAQTVDVVLAIRPAVLQIEGNFSHRFSIEEDPSIGGGCAGVPMTVPMSNGQRVVHVRDQQTKQVVETVLTAGRISIVHFL